jgi:hypothetical protein
MITQAFGEESMSHTRNPNSQRPKKATQVKKKVKIMIIIFFDIKGLFTKKFILIVQTINLLYYYDVLW